MKENLQKAVQAVKQAFDAEEHTFRDQITLIVDREDIIDVCTVLRDDHHFTKLTDETCVDYYLRKTPRFHVVYQLHSIEEDLRLWLRAPVPEEDPVISSLVEVYPNANWYEREIFDLFGVRFEGHPNLKRIMLSEDWEGHPLRKDVPVKVEESRFSFNWEEVDLAKNYIQREQDIPPGEEDLSEKGGEITT